MFNSGFVKSITFGIPSFSVEAEKLPKSYNTQEELVAPIDQGSKGICVSVCVTDMVRYAFKVAGKTYKKHLDFYYNHRSDKSIDGMTPRNAFEIAQAYSLVRSYATIKTLEATKAAIIANGPVLIALPVYNHYSDFWNADKDASPIGYHAVTLVGYDDKEEDFILRNSWGSLWGLNGYSYFPYKHFTKVIEAWTLFK